MWEGDVRREEVEQVGDDEVEEDRDAAQDVADEDEDDFGDDFDEFAEGGEEGADFGDFDEADEAPMQHPQPSQLPTAPDILAGLVSRSQLPSYNTTVPLFLQSW